MPSERFTAVSAGPQLYRHQAICNARLANKYVNTSTVVTQPDLLLSVGSV